MADTVYGSILHGAYGDYYEQALCLKHFRLTNPGVRVRLFAASAHRLAELRTLDFSWAESFELWTALEATPVDRFLQFQVRDPELRADVLPHLSPATLAKLDVARNRLPWTYLRSILPLRPEWQLGLSPRGHAELPSVMERNGIDPRVFDRPTVGFLWRHRAPGGAISHRFQPDAGALVAKWSRIFRRLIARYGCHVLVCGMGVKRTAENEHRIDAKYPEYGLDLPPGASTHLKGLSWALELEILSRCTLCVAHPSGFSEALWMKRGGGVQLVDVPPHYAAKALVRRMPLFGLLEPLPLAATIASGSERLASRVVLLRMSRCLGAARGAGSATPHAG
jgi:hypothetical protein